MTPSLKRSRTGPMVSKSMVTSGLTESQHKLNSCQFLSGHLLGCPGSTIPQARAYILRRIYVVVARFTYLRMSTVHPQLACVASFL
jgi:hypothetical protein